jgi:hypothetical protein
LELIQHPELKKKKKELGLGRQIRGGEGRRRKEGKEAC